MIGAISSLSLVRSMALVVVSVTLPSSSQLSSNFANVPLLAVPVKPLRLAPEKSPPAMARRR